MVFEMDTVVLIINRSGYFMFLERPKDEKKLGLVESWMGAEGPPPICPTISPWQN